jgi:ubiquinone/menaquinone biosynthesis C-methylase UbiE
MNENLNRVKQQFGPNAAAYATSQPHAKGESLGRLIELLKPQADWRALDIATGAGHVALALAPSVREVIASDITPAMLSTTAQLASERGLSNVRTEMADAEALPFRLFSFDLVTCRIAPHHFTRVDKFVAECARVVKRGGVLGIVDNITTEDAAHFVDGFERLRDPSHVHCLSMREWTTLLTQNGFEIEHHETLSKRMDFGAWVRQQKTPAHTEQVLARMLREAPAAAAWCLRPDVTGEGAVTGFTLTEGLFVCRMPRGH